MSFLADHAGVIGLLFFFVFFVCMAVWVYRPGSRDSYAAISVIPLQKDDDHE